jgi:hypothetical protein
MREPFEKRDPGREASADRFHRVREELRRRIRLIEESSRRRATGDPPAAGGEGAGPARTPGRSAAFPPGDPVPLETVFSGVEVGGGDEAFCHARLDAGEIWSGAGPFLERYLGLWRAPPEGWPEGGFRHVARLLHRGPPEGVAYLDLETTGLIGVPLFLVGLMRLDSGGLRVEQYFARDYTEERPLLADLERALRDVGVLVTFNGRSFDVPFLRDRFAVQGIPWTFQGEHLDLLPLCRRRWRGVLENCRLQTIEQAVCGRERVDDTPGSEIPGIYHEYVRTGDARHLGGIFEHNQWDVIAMAEILVALSHEGWAWHSPGGPSLRR